MEFSVGMCRVRSTRMVSGLLTNNFFRSKLLWSALAVSFFLITLYLGKTEERLDMHDVRMQIELSLRDSVEKERGSGCTMPHVEPFSHDISKYFPDLPKVTCDGVDWVNCYMSECYITDEIKSLMDHVDCTFSDIMYVTDMYCQLHHPTKSISGNERYYLKDSDHVKISCVGHKPGAVRSKTWMGYKAGFRPIAKKRPPEGSYNVLMLGFDSTSHNGFLRHMPMVYKYLTEEMQATVLNSYNILGDGTPAALFPLLTGKTEWELPDARKFTHHTIDNKNFIFDPLNEMGYRTAFFEDMPAIGTFQYRFNGFRRQPADHYLRHLLETSHNDNLFGEDKKKKRCNGAVPEYLMIMNLTAQLFELKGNQFCFTFICALTHDEFNLKTAERDTLIFLRNFLISGKMENTMLIMMSDHGIRFSSEFRSTYQGKMEERLPFMAIMLPERLKVEIPDAALNLKRNAHVLTTAFDVHETIVDVLKLDGRSNDYKIPGSDLPRGMSLLRPIPSSRSCGEAGVETHWCACSKWFNVSRHEPMFRRAAQALADRINDLTARQRSLCVERHILSVEWVLKRNVNDEVLRFDGSKDRDGFLGMFTRESRARADVENYEAKIVMSPGRAVFEGSMKYYVKTDYFFTSDRDISRTNAYNDEPSCISSTYPHLNKYCYCIENLRKTEPLNIAR